MYHHSYIKEVNRVTIHSTDCSHFTGTGKGPSCVLKVQVQHYQWHRPEPSLTFFTCQDLRKVQAYPVAHNYDCWYHRLKHLMWILWVLGKVPFKSCASGTMSADATTLSSVISLKNLEVILLTSCTKTWKLLLQALLLPGLDSGAKILLQACPYMILQLPL